ncbi:hypothetical protein OG948_12325 [Embleya sp. NBC_00888]|uniref:hypothetical protein n=1 Tax=Embleya sp. NBC_00888 TaxID=2975960 RepID=UPI0038665B5F|nr:hypothetical protein OG948_12325 [Embleya sp. NBC_00888]
MAAIPQDLLDRLRTLENQVRELAGRANIRPAMNKVFNGDFTIGEGGRLMVGSQGPDPILWSGWIVPRHPDGSPQRGTFLAREKGGVALALFTGGDSPQDLVLFDTRGYHVVKTTEAGLGRPYLPVPMKASFPGGWDRWPFVSGTTQKTLVTGLFYKQQPQISVAAQASTDTDGTFGEIRVLLDGVAQGSAQPVKFYADEYRFGPFDLPGGHMSEVRVELVGRMTGSTGALRADVIGAWTHEKLT